MSQPSIQYNIHTKPSLMVTTTYRPKGGLPMQPLEIDHNGIVRFVPNLIVNHLLEKGGLDLNDIARLGFPDADREQFAQLIGYSASGYGDLDYVNRHTSFAADVMAEALVEFEAAALRHGKSTKSTRRKA